MYYNYGAALRADHQFDQAADGALKRRELWPGNASRLLSVAVELAALSTEIRSDASNADLDSVRCKIDDAVLVTLHQVRDADPKQQLNFAQDKNFAYYRSNEQFKTLLAESHNESAVTSTVHSTGSSSTDN